MLGTFLVPLISWHFVYYLSIVLLCTDPCLLFSRVQAENSKKEDG